MEEPKIITLGFYYNDKESFNEVETFLDLPIYDDIEPELVAICRTFDNFLRQVGYVRRGDGMLHESITDDEADALCEFLDEYRQEKRSEECMEIRRDERERIMKELSK